MTGPLAAVGRGYDRLFARAYDPVLAGPERAGLGRARDGLLADATGGVLEIGAGTGANLAHLPSSGMTSLLLVEPSGPMRDRLEQRVRSERRHLPEDTRIVEGSAAALSVADASIDTVVSTLVLCSVPDLDAAVRELRRVLAPGGRLQGVIDPGWRVVARGCRLVRDTRTALERGGFDTSDVADWRMPGGGVTGPALLGVARPR